jgi:hypothetical protein
MWLVTTRPIAPSERGMAVAKRSGTPAVMCSGGRT